ncbi:MAG: MFS transporter, partial [Lachnospiraceae bacterium]|nr:MFS transporter [Lachnospiraceae bacterium]
MKNFKETFKEMKSFLLLWSTQSLSGLGSAMTSYVLVIWSYSQKGSALMTALLMVCSYAPYVVFSIFAGALSDRWNKKTVMLVCDTIAALTTVIMLILMRSGQLKIWHLYVINVVNGLMNTVQQPASEVAVTRVLPRKYYQKVGGMRYFASSLNSILSPIIATAILGLAGMDMIVIIDLCTFGAAFLTLAFGIKIPSAECTEDKQEKLIDSVKKGIGFLKKERGIFDLILFLAAINLVASVYDAAFPAMILSRNGGSERVLGVVNAVIGVS